MITTKQFKTLDELYNFYNVKIFKSKLPDCIVNLSRKPNSYGYFLLGYRFAPRIRDIDDAKLYAVTKTTDYENVTNILQGRINTNIIRDNYDDVLRLACSIRKGCVSGSLMMSKLGSFLWQQHCGKWVVSKKPFLFWTIFPTKH